MRDVRVAVFVHLVWATWDRLPLLTLELREPVLRAIAAKCGEAKAEIVAVGGIEDHVHLLIRLPATMTVADLAGQVKGSSAHLVTHRLLPGEFFKWQGGYGAFSVSLHDVGAVRDYILQQAERHATGALVAAWEPAPSLE